MADTLLVITGVGLPSWSARGLNQTLAPIDASAQMRRTVNGELLDISYLPFQKYGSKITCDDLRIPAIDGVWPGDEVTVECVAELSYPTGGTAQRPAVPGSSRTEGGFVFYRPILVMLVKQIETQTDEWGATMQWTLDLEER